jgi:phosphatidylglycerophosphate synthase
MDKPLEPVLPLSLNIPNVFTGLRVIFTIAAIVLLLRDQTGEAWIAGILLIIAWSTDWLDGFLARKLGQATLSGAIFDLIADRFLMSTILIISIFQGFWEQTAGLMPFNPFPYAGLVLAADLALLAGILIYLYKRRTRTFDFPTPTRMAKFAFPVQMLTLVVAILGIAPAGVLVALMYLTIVFTLIASYSYLKKGSYVFTQ